MKNASPCRRTLRVLAAALSLFAVAVTASRPAHADPPKQKQQSWCYDWQGCEYRCGFGNYQGKLTIDFCQEDGSCCYWEGTCYLYDRYGRQFTCPCEGYAQCGGFCYFKVGGCYNWCCMGSLSRDLRQMGGDCCDFDHCGYCNWYCEYLR
jgi:hypothetical protein